ncbi:MAG TPA: histidine kinase, partial [Chloroflexota bacterium]|nr:histidine kinase [Chloroflexota bacterium]
MGHSLVFGHFMFLLNRDNFLQARALSRNAAELESKVADKTHELRHLLSSVERAREGERAHVARELHDELG